MMRAEELAARAERLSKLGEGAIDLSYARSLRHRAQYCRDMAAELRILERDPLYRLIHDRPDIQP
jgi:hypothetical protein